MHGPQMAADKMERAEWHIERHARRISRAGKRIERATKALTDRLDAAAPGGAP